MKRILQVNYTMNIGGIETFLLNVLNVIDKDKYSFSFLCYSNSSFDYEEKINELGANIFRIDHPKKVGFLKHYRQIKDLLTREKFDVVHCHTYFNSAVVLLAAKRVGVKVRIAHSHTTEGNNKVSIMRKIKWYLCSMAINMFSTHRLACSVEAGEALFHKKNFIVLTNGILVDKFKFNNRYRENIRRQYNISNNDFLIGHIGRLSPEKNHFFMLDILYALKNNKKTNYKMMFVGGGDFKEKIFARIDELHLNNEVILVGSATDAYKYYSAFDLFLFPSIYEGLGISLIEAQTNGLYCLASKSVPIESKLTDNIEFLDIKNIQEYVDKIEKNHFLRSESAFESIKSSKYSIHSTVDSLSKIYDIEKL